MRSPSGSIGRSAERLRVHVSPVSSLTSARRLGAAKQIAGWLGLANMIYVLGSSIAVQWAVFTTAKINPIPFVGLHEAALTGGIVGAFVVVSGRVRGLGLAYAAAVGLWVGSAALSGWVLTRRLDTDLVALAIVASGLALSASASPKKWSGWALLFIGSAYVYVNLYLILRFSSSGGIDFPRAGTGLQLPDSGSSGALLWRFIADGVVGRSYFVGLTPNSNLTGNCLVALSAFMAPFILSQRPFWSTNRTVTVCYRAALLAILVLPAMALMTALVARTALAGLICSFIVLTLKQRWLNSRWAPITSAFLTPIVVATPVVLATFSNLSASGRDCVWESWWAQARRDWLLGSGSPGSFPALGCTRRQTWSHAHNELLQAWGVSGLLGLAILIVILSGLGFVAVRFYQSDHRTLLAVMAASAVLMGFEVVGGNGWVLGPDWLVMGLVSFVAVTARSVGIMDRRTLDRTPV